MSHPKISDTDISPPNFSNHVVRNELVKQLRRAQKKLTLIQGPPGYGKTGLLCQIFHASKSEPKVASVWLNIRQSDNDPINLIRKIEAALRTCQGKSDYYHLDGFTPPSFTPWVRSLIDEMNELNALNIYINDVDFLVDLSVIDIINSIIRLSASTVRIYITTTKSVGFSYSHLLIENQVASVTQEALRFTKKDVEKIFVSAKKTVPKAQIVQKMLELTEGWPVAIYYVALNLDDQSLLEPFMFELSQGQIAFDRYFIERVFERQSPGLRKLMLKLAMLERFNIELCQQLSDEEQDSQQLATYIQNNTFISAIDSSNRWFRFHQLFNIFLRKRCQFELSIGELMDTRIRSAQWFREFGLEEEAIDLLLQAKDYQQSAIWMEEAFPTVVVRYAKHATYLDWYKALPEEVVNQNPRVRLGYILSLCAGREFLSAAEQIAVVERNKKNYEPEIQKEITRIVSLVVYIAKGLNDEAYTLRTEITDWLEEWGDHSHYRNTNDFHYELGLAWLLKGFTEKCLSSFSEAKTALNNGLAHLQAYGSYYGQCWARALLAVTFAKQGFHHEALREAREGYDLAQEKLGDKSHLGYSLAALIAAISYEYNELEVAESYLEGGLDYVKEQSSTDMLMASYETQARIFMNENSVEEGMGFLKDGIKWAESQALTRLTLKLVDELIVWLLRQHRVAEAEQYSSQYDLIVGRSEDFKISKFEHKVAARSIIFLLLEKQCYDCALEILGKLIARGETLGHLRRTAEWLKLEAISFWLSGDTARSKQSLVKTLESASTQNYLRLFLDDAVLLQPILKSIEPSVADKSYSLFLKTLVKLIEADDCGGHPGVEVLTPKETEIIKLLEKGLTNRQAAEQLFISEGTLKWHLHNVYSKLQVKNRNMALVTARKLGYI